MKWKPRKYLILLIALLIPLGYWISTVYNLNFTKSVGQEIDQFNGVAVYYNGGVNNVSQRNLTADGYNLGLKYQCVEFVKRYYYQHLRHKMPDSYGHAKDFFIPTLKDGQMNEKRALMQCTNPSEFKPKVNDLLIFDAYIFNRFGHVAIVSQVAEDRIEFVQQNAGPFADSRETCGLRIEAGKYCLENRRILGWLRMP